MKIALGLAGVSISGVWAAFDSVVPTDDALPTGNPPGFFDRRENIISPLGVSSSLDTEPALLHTNKFYSNFLIDGPQRSAWTLPYIVTVNDETPYGMYVSYPKFFNGQFEDDGRLKWYATTTTKDLIVAATEVNDMQEATMTGFDEYGLSATVRFENADHPQGRMTTYLVRGMAYATVEYENYTPEVSSIHAILSVNGQGVDSSNHTDPDGRFEIELNDGSTWILYSSDDSVEFYYTTGLPNEPRKLQAIDPMSGTLRVTMVPYESGDSKFDSAVSLLDMHSAVYPTSGSVTAEVEKDTVITGRYMIEWDVAGDTTVDLLHYALPHHQDLLASAHKTNIYLSSPTKGDMMLVKSSTWEFYENDMTDMDFLPSATAVTNDLELEWVTYYLEREISATLDNYAGSSVYFGGKNLMAYAQLCLIADELNMSDLTETCLDQVESAFSEYVEGINGNPLVIDTTWGGLIGSAGLEEDNGGADFYAVYYNDHHFHYSYLVNAAAVLAKMRPAWATGDNKDFVETLIRDVNSPSTNDDHFPAFRSFDWFSGHSWARGLLFAFDGKDQESTSEDVNFYYAMTMWAIATGNSKLEGLGRLQTAMVARSIQRYFLLKDDNDVHPPDFVRNKVTGIFFESKIDYTTWFGDNVEYIHGIQNIPVTAITEYVRDPQFCKEEWDQRLAGVVGETSGSWTTVLYMSFATMERHLAFQQMLTSGVDDGLSRAWALYWAATRPDCDEYCPHVEVDLENVPLPTPAPTVPTGGFGGEASIPGLIQAEEYDYGGNGVGYGDTTPGNSGGFFRTDDVDVNEIETGLFYVGWTEPTEYLRYSVDVAIDGGTYIFDFSVASPGVSPPGSFRVVAGGTDCTDYDTDLTGLVEVPFTGGWREFATMSMPGREGASLAAGPAHLFICIESSGFNIDSFSMNAVLTPTPTPVDQLEGGFEGGVEIPGKIEAEKFDYGGPGVAYSDVDSGNNGGEFRLDEGVDIDTTDDGYYVGWTASSEYMRYTVDVTEAADAFDFEFVVAVPPNRSPAFRVVAGGSDCTDYDTDLSGVVQPSTTGPSWYGFESFSVQAGGDGGLPAGPAVLFFCTESSGFNIDSFTMTVSSDDDGSAYEGGADVPGTIEAERFDNGGQGVAYSDTDSSNKGREFRLDEGVDIDTTDDGYYVGWTASSEYMRYTVDVTEAADAFDFEFVVAVPRNRSPAFRVVAGGSDCTDYDTDLSGVVQPSATGPSWYRFESFSVQAGGDGGLPAGPAVLFFCTESSGFNIDSFTMTVSSDDDGSAYEGGADVPGTIEAERFDNGGQGVAYSDTDSSNKGREFRLDEGVDIDTTDDGYYVGWTASSEYMRYTVDVTEAADAFDFEFVVAVPRNRSPAFRVVAGGSDCTDYDTDLSGVVQPSATGPSWYRFESFSVLAGGTGGLPEGPATLFFCTESPGFNIDSFTMTVAT